jgi:hypothetical protein
MLASHVFVLPSELPKRGFPIEILHAFLTSLILNTYPAHHNLLDLTILATSGNMLFLFVIFKLFAYFILLLSKISLWKKCNFYCFEADTNFHVHSKQSAALLFLTSLTQALRIVGGIIAVLNRITARVSRCILRFNFIMKTVHIS